MPQHMTLQSTRVLELIRAEYTTLALPSTVPPPPEKTSMFVHHVTDSHYHLFSLSLQAAAVQGQALYVGVSRGDCSEHVQVLLGGQVCAGQVDNNQLGRQDRQEGEAQGGQL